MSPDRKKCLLAVLGFLKRLVEWVRAVCARLGGNVVVVVLESLTY